jgi:hypothetical protein
VTRKKLGRMEGERKTFTGVFVRYGHKKAFRGPYLRTLLLRDVREIRRDLVVTDHLWFNLTKGFEALGELTEGDVIQFDARVKAYHKGYRGYDWEKAIENPVTKDWKLSHPTKIKRVGDEEATQ